jgi:predicted nucleic acid-binding protein
VGLIDAIGPGPVALDTVAFIYFVEQHPVYVDLLRPIFALANDGRVQLVTSAVTLLEVLVVPYRAGDSALAAEYDALLTRGRGLTLVDLTSAQLRLAAELRARTGIRTPDALQLAAALTERCTTLITNDRGLPSLPGLRVVQLKDFVR